MSDVTGRRVEGCRITFGDDAAISTMESVDPSQVIVVEFDRDKQRVLSDAAIERHEAMKDRYDLPYGFSTPHGQLVGVLGEAGVAIWLYESLPAQFEFSGDQPGGADAYVRNPDDNQGWTLIETKCHGSSFWHGNGRLVNAQQLPRMAAEVIVWCVAPEPIGERVVVVGWSPVADVRASGVPEMTGARANVRAHAELRPPQQLVDWLLSGREAPLSVLAQ